MNGVEQILLAVAAAVVYALAGYFKSSGENFDRDKFMTTIVVGIVVGFVKVYLNLPSYEASLDLLTSMGLIVVIENICKVIWRRVFGVKVKVVQPLAK
jgi:hypothetical protein